jgi:CYTH domain-containing protein
MPIENELKFVLKLESEDLFSSIAKSKKDIKQGYLTFEEYQGFKYSTRIRNTNNSIFEFTHKQKVYDEIIEIEKSIEKEDFEKLWQISFNKLSKIRYNAYFEDALWEVDAFKKENGETYFLMAEFEMPARQISPLIMPSLSMPSLISDNLVFPVPKEDVKFSSNNLANICAAKDLYALLLNLL